jgi:hypothetical protein
MEMKVESYEDLVNEANLLTSMIRACRDTDEVVELERELAIIEAIMEDPGVDMYADYEYNSAYDDAGAY